MRRIGVYAVAIALTATGVALAATYKTGRYSAGVPSGHAAGIDLTIHTGSFSVRVMSFHERCSSRKRSFTDWFEFVSGPGARLTGTVSTNGRLSGKWVSRSGTDEVTGTVYGSKATVNGSEDTRYQPKSPGPVYECKGSDSFNATRRRS